MPNPFFTRFNAEGLMLKLTCIALCMISPFAMADTQADLNALLQGQNQQSQETVARSQTVNRSLSRAETQMDQGDSEGAVSSLQTALANTEPNDKTSIKRINAAMTSLSIGNLTRAQRNINRAQQRAVNASFASQKAMLDSTIAQMLQVCGGRQ